MPLKTNPVLSADSNRLIYSAPPRAAPPSPPLGLPDLPGAPRPSRSSPAFSALSMLTLWGKRWVVISNRPDSLAFVGLLRMICNHHACAFSLSPGLGSVLQLGPFVSRICRAGARASPRGRVKKISALIESVTFGIVSYYVTIHAGAVGGGGLPAVFRFYRSNLIP
jgi:hypothetical protein